MLLADGRVADGLLGERPLGQLLAADQHPRRVDPVQRGDHQVLGLLALGVDQAGPQLDPTRELRLSAPIRPPGAL